jgi:trans-aconitate methyltransferase
MRTIVDLDADALSDLVCGIGQSGCTRLLEARMKNMAVTTLDQPLGQRTQGRLVHPS